MKKENLMNENQNNETKEKKQKAPMKERAKAWWQRHKFKLGCLGFLILGIITAILGIKAKEAFDIELPDLPELPDPDEGEGTEEDEEPPTEDINDENEETQETE